MNQNLWSAVDDYIADILIEKDPALAHVLGASEAAQLPPIAVSAPLGKFLTLLARMNGAGRILEIGTLGGYSAICLARALPPGGRLITLENNPVCAEAARENFAAAGLEEVVELRQGEALETLRDMKDGGEEAFDFIFIDANKPDYPDYLALCLDLSRPGTAILADNTVRGGEIIDSAGGDYSVQGVRRMHEMIRADSRLEATSLQTVGAKGYDGFTLIRVR